MSSVFDKDTADLFRKVTVRMDWIALAASNARISRVRLSAQDLDAVLVPWFVLDGVPVCDQRHKAVPYFPNVHFRPPMRGDTTVTVGQAAADGFTHPLLDAEDVRRKERLVGDELVLPVYDVRIGYMILDGNHRSIAARRTNRDVAVELVVIRGPIDGRVLPDLAVFE